MPTPSAAARAPTAMAHSYSAGYPYARGPVAPRPAVGAPMGLGSGGAFLEEFDDPTVDARGMKKREGSVVPVRISFYPIVCLIPSHATGL